jgi:glucose/arabinose dehydrogenase
VVVRLRPLLLAILALAAWPGTAAASHRVALDPQVTGLQSPASFTFLPDGRLLYGERLTGQIRLADPVAGTDVLWATVPDLVSTGEQGLLGLAVDPAYPSRPDVYAVATRLVDGASTMQVLRIAEVAGEGGAQTPIFSTPAAEHHVGGRLLFGKDRRLYLVIGDHFDPSSAQDPASPWGKVLRMTRAGRPAPGNPAPDSPVFASGFRNSFGLALDRRTGNIWETENGPECTDEVNRVIAGGNYGWGPSATCLTPPDAPQNTNQDGSSPLLPAWWWAAPIAPTGAAFCDGCDLGTGSGKRLYVADFLGGRIHALRLVAGRLGFGADRIVFADPSLKLLALEPAPDGAIWVSGTTQGAPLGGFISRLAPA